MEQVKNKTIVGNKGEWSEFYVFIKLLDERQLFTADENLIINKETAYPVLKIFRNELPDGKKIYDLENTDGKIKITDYQGTELAIVDGTNLKKKIKEIFEEISKAKKKNAFAIKEADEILKELRCTNIKTASSQKADITVTIRDAMGLHPEMGYSIKSMIGSASTLLNSSGATNFIYEITGLDDKLDIEINKAKKFKDKLNIIYKHGGEIKFTKTSSETFKNNLQLIDNTFHQVLAEFILNYYEGKGKTFEKILSQLNQDRIQSGLNVAKSNYQFKIKNFLINVALGMVPSSEWDAYMKASGGYIIVKKDGEICCYQLYNRDKFQDYLYNNVRFETPSTTKFKFGNVYKEDGKKYIKLNLQIRFIK